MDKLFESIGVIINKVKSEHKKKDWSGILECPICKKKLYVSHAAINGHTRGKCETENCINWIE
jgi:hypothetical protein